MRAARDVGERSAVYARRYAIGVVVEKQIVVLAKSSSSCRIFCQKVVRYSVFLATDQEVDVTLWSTRQFCPAHCRLTMT
jgi:hypothetical protein